MNLKARIERLEAKNRPDVGHGIVVVAHPYYRTCSGLIHESQFAKWGHKGPRLFVPAKEAI